ncbi:hypothetical protein SAMN05421833_102322 [Microbispora rosea]|uniref:Uncharacterized protein n=1 Tax=Microbispora rosea TaxID=58117 RepID=A0A1N6TE42_9ACTN|nr:hypothetical protein Mro03_02800 [Microbispora rosea subsp. rosea]SIQ51524.1 hypothetical protein SAMN05421833_102322 [Microbispora rosea]
MGVVVLKVDTGRLREPAAWTMLAVVITSVLVSIARMLIGSSLSSTFGIRAAASLYSLVSPVSTALAFGAVLLVAKAGAPTPRARLVALGAAGSLGLGIVFGVIAVLGVLVGDLATFRDRFEYLITGLPMVALAVFGALFALSTASALQPAREPAGGYFGRSEDAYPPQPYAPVPLQGPQVPQGPQGPGPMPAQQMPQNVPQNVPQTPPQNAPHQGQPQGPAYGQNAPAPVHPQLPPAEHRYAEHQQYPQEQYSQEQYAQEYEPQPSYSPAPTAPQSPQSPQPPQPPQPAQPQQFGQPAAPAPVHGQAQQQPRPSLHDVQTGAHYSDYGAYGAQPEAPAAPQRPDYSPPPQGPVFDQYGYAGQQSDSAGYGQFPSAPPSAPTSAPNVPSAPGASGGYGQPSSYNPSPAPEARPYEQEQPYGQGSPFSGYSGQAFARQAAEHAAGGPAFDAPPAYEGPADPREQQLAQAYQQAQSYQKGALPDHPTGPQDMPEYYDNPLGHPQSEPAPFQPPMPGPADQTVRFDASGYQGDPLSDPLHREEPLDPTAIYTPDRSQAKYEEGSAPDQAGLGTDPNLPWYGSER